MDWLSEFNVVDFGYTEEPTPFSFKHYAKWVESKKHHPLLYLEGERFDKRQNIKNYWPEFQSALVFLFSYHPTHLELKNIYQKNPNWNGLKIASFTLGFEGDDYHDCLMQKLQKIGERLTHDYGVAFRPVLDTHPVLERDLALRAGLGWFGKNSMLINRHHGSYFIIGSLLLDQKLGLASKIQDVDHCGQCTLCADACPTEAIDLQTRTIMAKDCISTFTIEQFKLETIPSEKMDLTSGYIFGCDICQDVCPWNKRVERNNEVRSASVNPKQQGLIDFFLTRPRDQLLIELESISGGEFKRKMEKTSFSRSGKRGLLKNIRLYIRQKLNILP